MGEGGLTMTTYVKALRARLFALQGGFCHYCGKAMQPMPEVRLGTISKRTVTLEHLKPQSEGGRTTLENCVAACRGCNEARGNMPAEQWDALLSAMNEARA